MEEHNMNNSHHERGTVSIGMRMGSSDREMSLSESHKRYASIVCAFAVVCLITGTASLIRYQLQQNDFFFLYLGIGAFVLSMLTLCLAVVICYSARCPWAQRNHLRSPRTPEGRRSFEASVSSIFQPTAGGVTTITDLSPNDLYLNPFPSFTDLTLRHYDSSVSQESLHSKSNSGQSSHRMPFPSLEHRNFLEGGGTCIDTSYDQRSCGSSSPEGYNRGCFPPKNNSPVSSRYSPPTESSRPSPPTVSSRPSPPTMSSRPSPPTVSSRPSPPAASRSSPPRASSPASRGSAGGGGSTGS